MSWPPSTAAPEPPSILARSELVVCFLATLAAVWLHWVFLTHAGPLWRDEVGGIGIALMPSLGELWQKLTFDASPLGSPLLWRAWAALGLGGSDFGWRLYGFLAGLVLLGAVWFNARTLGRKWPVFSLGLLTANVVLVRWGDSVRAYGIGCASMLVTLGLVWRLAQAPSRGRFALAAISAVLSVHILYQNAFLLLAAGLAAALVGARHRRWNSVVLVLGTGAIAAVSLLPYVPGIRASATNWWVIQKSGFVPGWVWFNIASAMGSPHEWQVAVWIVLACVAAVGGLALGWRGDDPESDLVLFAAVTLLLATGLFMAFIWMSALPTQVWYYLPLLTFVAACVNAALPKTLDWIGRELAAFFSGRPARRNPAEPAPETPRSSPPSKAAPAVFAALMVLVSLPAADARARVRQTNLDLVAAFLSSTADAEDVIVIHPWYCGVTFHRYYHGKAAWFTAPPMPDYRVPHFDVLMRRMLEDDPMAPVLERCAKALAAGRRLYLVGWFILNGEKPPELPKPPNGPQGWNEVPYEDVWAAQVAFLAKERATEFTPLRDQTRLPISDYENLSIVCAQGWRAQGTNGPAPR